MRSSSEVISVESEASGFLEAFDFFLSAGGVVRFQDFGSVFRDLGARRVITNKSSN